MEKDRVIVIAAHPDDEILGVGGTAALHAMHGDEVIAVIACEGASLRYKGKIILENFSRKAAKIIGFSDIVFLNFPDQRLDKYSLIDIIGPLERLVKEFRPTVVYTQFGGDINRDHQLLFQAVLVSTRPVESYIRSIYAFDTASSTEWGFPQTFIPDTWVDISKTLDIKLRALSIYESEVREYPHPRSIKAIEYRAKAWGNRVVMDAAEVFMTVRRVIRDGKTPY